jgi:hypothetical protein
LKEHTGARVDEVEAGVEVEAAPEATGRPQSDATELRPQVQLADLLVPPRKPRKGTGMHISDITLRVLSYQPSRRRLRSRASHPFGYRVGR